MPLYSHKRSRHTSCPQLKIAKDILSKMFEAEQTWHSFRVTAICSRDSIWRGSTEGHGTFLVCIPNIMPQIQVRLQRPYHSSWQKTWTSSKIICSFKRLTWELGYNELSGMLLLFFWEIFAGISQRPVQGGKLKRIFFFFFKAEGYLCLW